MAYIISDMLTLMQRDAPLPGVKEPGDGTKKVKVSRLLKKPPLPSFGVKVIFEDAPTVTGNTDT